MRAAVSLVLFWSGLAFAEERKGFTNLIEDATLKNWDLKQSKGEIKDYWNLTDGVLKAKPGKGWLCSKEQYGNFTLHVEWKIFSGGNSGVFIRVPGVKEGFSPSQTGAEIQILDDNSAKYKGKVKPYQFSGSLYSNVPCTKQVFRGAGEWNTFDITCQGDEIKVVYNGEKVIETNVTTIPALNKRPRKGFIGLQNHGSAVEFRSVEIKTLD